ncbi:RagB/SusD family nutrient uptake outer membrane protein [Parabacteroides faecis]|uniref:RagB/SusD family nutrient uptake outer membrane protein n=1 Tax=Parabacteroides TaxID=375288 RepID=UPI000F010677|nr:MULTISPECIES: RagB/SusD family nutrient uptake outer membrane protein [Parabacteroides]MBC8618396.1 RagB/SusD family nutrient uptake outer membrane protein [Parabacteroides faecis]RHR93229.1 RagB/SusD family nutrient uptake outer membrane protein [Parabacteroides sp. AF14-59]
MKKLLFNIIPGIIVIMLAGCSDFLDKTSSDYSSSGFYQSEAAIKSGAEGVYNYLYMELGYAIPFNISLDHYTGMAFERNENTTIGAGGGLNPDNNEVKTFWNKLYIVIARANSVIYGSKEYIDGLGDNAHQYLAEVKVLRAFAYYNLIATYGDVPFFTDPVTIEQYKETRVSREDILDFILTDLEESASALPWIATSRGRVDKAVAYGLKARAALLGGSLNYRGQGADYFRISAEAAGKVIGQRSLAQSFDDLFNITGQAKADVRNEMLWELMYSDQGIKKTHVVAFGQVSRNTGQTGRHPSMLLADTYECIDGKRIDESSLYDPRYPQKNRDPRFRSTLWMHGDTATVNNGNLVRQIINAYDIEAQFYDFSSNTWYLANNADINSSAAWASFCNAGVGYIWAKFSNETAENISAQSCNIPIMRYAEVLLTYAEAKIELNELENTVYDAINQVRNRVAMPDVSADRIGNQDKMRQLVRRERKVEFALEGLHHVDMRRWGIGDLENGQPTYGLPLPEIGYEGLTSTDIPNFKTSERTDLNDIPNYDAYKSKLKVRDRNRFWNKKFELWPVPQLERDRNPNLSQNEGY